MKKFMKGAKDLILRHKLLSLICLIVFIIILIMFYIFFSMFVGGNDKYGDRLKGIESVEIRKSDLTKVSDELKKQDGVMEASARIQGKIIYINLVFNRETSLDRAKEVAASSLDKFDKDEKSYYDFGYFLTQVEQEGTEDKGFVVTGTKNAELEGISWIKS